MSDEWQTCAAGCGKWFPNRQSMSRHLNSVHIGDKPIVIKSKFPCPTCFENFSRSTNRRRHELSKHGFVSVNTNPTYYVQATGKSTTPKKQATTTSFNPNLKYKFKVVTLPTRCREASILRHRQREANLRLRLQR